LRTIRGGELGLITKCLRKINKGQLGKNGNPKPKRNGEGKEGGGKGSCYEGPFTMEVGRKDEKSRQKRKVKRTY